MTSKYSVIKYIPDILRNEKINIGLITLNKKEIYLSKVTNYRRIKIFINDKSSNYQIEYIKSFLDNFITRFNIGKSKYEEDNNKDIDNIIYFNIFKESINNSIYSNLYFEGLKSSLDSPKHLLNSITKEILF